MQKNLKSSSNVNTLAGDMMILINVFRPTSYHQYGRYWYIGMARVPYMRNTNMHARDKLNQN